MTNGNWYDIMQVCENGHQITSCAHSQQNSRKDFCDECGAKTIVACPHCEKPIQGYYHVEGIVSLSEPPVPKYCSYCGAAFPWQQSAIDNLTGIFRESDLSPQDIAIAEAALPDILQDTPKTESASLRLKRIMGKLGKPLYEISIKVVTDIASETAKKTIGL